MYRPKKKGSKVETGAWNTIGVQSIPLTEVRQSIKYSKSDRVCDGLHSFVCVQDLRLANAGRPCKCCLLSLLL